MVEYMDVISKIKLNTIEDVKAFVATASACDFDIEVSYQEQNVDARSLLGMLNINLDYTLNVVSYGYDKDLERILKKYEVK